MIHTEIDNFVRYLDSELGYSHNTMVVYRHDLKSFLEFLGDYNANPEIVSVDMTAMYLQSLSMKGLASATVCRMMYSTTAYFQWLIATGRRRDNPCKSLSMPKKEWKIPRVLSPESVGKLICSVRGQFRLRDQAILELLYGGGLRVSEISPVKLIDYYPRLLCIRVFGKGAKERIVHFGANCLTAIELYIQEDRPALVNRYGASDKLFLPTMNRMFLWRMVHRACDIAGLPRVNPHSLRHSFASHLLSGGADLEAIRQMLGHEDIATTQRYTHVDLVHLREIHKLHPRQ